MPKPVGKLSEQRRYIPIKFRLFQHEKISKLRDELSTESNNDKMSLADTIMEAIEDKIIARQKGGK